MILDIYFFQLLKLDKNKQNSFIKIYGQTNFKLGLLWSIS